MPAPTAGCSRGASAARWCAFHARTVAKKIEGLAGKKVALAYEEHRGVPLTCFGDTGYFVRDARAAE